MFNVTILINDYVFVNKKISDSYLEPLILKIA